MKMKPCLFLLFIALMLLVVSCETYQPAFVLTLHEFDDPQMMTNLSKTVQDPTRQFSHTIRKYPFLSSRNFLDGEIYGPSENGRYGLRILVNRWDQGAMHQIAGANIGLVYAVIMDGIYAGYSHFNKSMRDSEILEIDPLWNLRDAQMILDNIPKNYKHFNKWHEPKFQP